MKIYRSYHEFPELRELSVRERDIRWFLFQKALERRKQLLAEWILVPILLLGFPAMIIGGILGGGVAEKHKFSEMIGQLVGMVSAFALTMYPTLFFWGILRMQILRPKFVRWYAVAEPTVCALLREEFGGDAERSGRD